MKSKTIIEQLNELQKHHHYVLHSLYRAQRDGERDGRGEDYWKGALNALEVALDMLGVEHESYNPLHEL